MTYYLHLTTPIGKIRLRANDHGLTAVDHVNQQGYLDSGWIEDTNHPILTQAEKELQEYFSGGREFFETPLSPIGTAFQLSVWKALRKIPYGTTASYAEIANTIGNPKAVRAVGAANGRNPLSIFIPCHRIIGKSGKLVGYAGGIEAKQVLLSLEFRLS